MLIYQIELSAEISAVTLKLRLTSIDNFIYLKQTLDSPWVSNFPFLFVVSSGPGLVLYQ